MKRPAAAFVLAVAVAARALSPGERAAPLGSATLATNAPMTWCGWSLGDRNTWNGHAFIDLPAPTRELTVTAWRAVRGGDGAERDPETGRIAAPGGQEWSGDPRGSSAVPLLDYVPDFSRGAPDLLGGAWGWGGEPVTLGATALRFAHDFPPPDDADAAALPQFARGCYAVAWTNLDADAWISLAGTNYALKAPCGARSFLPGPDPSAGIALSGSGRAQVGVARQRIHRIYECGGASGQGLGDAGATAAMIDAALVSTNWVFVAHRIRLDGDAHTNSMLVVAPDGSALVHGARHDLPPDGTRALMPSGIYHMRWLAIGSMRLDYAYEWDRRVFARWLSDSELDAVRADGLRARAMFGYPSAVITNAVFQIDP